MTRKLSNSHLKNFERRYLALQLRECYFWMNFYTSDVCICEEKGKSDSLINVGFVLGVLSKKESERYRKAFWNLYKDKRGFVCKPKMKN